MSLYGEVVEKRAEIELEAKVNLQRRIGRLRVMANLTAEREFYFDGRHEWVLNPAGGVTYEVLPPFHPGVEYWMRAEFPAASRAAERSRSVRTTTSGRPMLFNFGRLWWSSGALLPSERRRARAGARRRVGHIWLRTIVGMSL